MSKNKQCVECQTTESVKFRSLRDEKWKMAKNKNLVKVTWTEGVVLCNICYMHFVENPLRKGHKRVKAMDERIPEMSMVDKVSIVDEESIIDEEGIVDE